jgi:4-diphosphocytidyl-2-C-methyl-D-erythritol kinase
MMAADIVRAPAKLTLELRVVGVRNDGYHLIDAEMVTLGLADVLRITPRAKAPSRLTVTGPHGDGIPAGPDNLVARALDLAGRTADVTVEKHIPAGGGLGGGSADAAAVLRWAGWTDARAAVVIGADVPFCLVGGRARVQGIGEIVQPMQPFAEARGVVLVCPPLHVSTPAVYAAWDELGGPRAAGTNDLEPAALAVAPELARYRDRIAEACGMAPVLAGSGATWFIADADEGDAAAIAEAVAEAVVVHTTIEDRC